MNLCNQLNYQRSLSTGKAYFYYLSKDNEICALEKDRSVIRAPKGGYAEAYNGNNYEPKNLAPQDLAYSNLLRIEECYVPPGVNEVYLGFSMRINANSIKPLVCNSDDVRNTLIELAEVYKNLGGYSELACRYAKNILMGTWLWRNRGPRCLQIEITTSESDKYVIENAIKLNWYDEWDKQSKNILNNLTAYLEKALSDPAGYFYIDILAKMTVNWGDEIYPSQKFLDIKEDGVPTKQLKTATFENGKETVSLTGPKVGAAIQTIDDWWCDDADKPLRVNEYGADREYVIARRHPTFNNDFYHLIRNTEGLISDMRSSETIPNAVHFIMSVLIKGGLFNCSSSS